MPTRGAKRPRRPPLGELLSEREAEGVRYDERYAPGFTYATVGADSIRPKPRIFDSTRLNGITHKGSTSMPIRPLPRQSGKMSGISFLYGL